MGLDSVELVMSWEREFEIRIPNGTAAGLVTPRDAADAIAEILQAAGRPAAREVIEEVIRTTTLDLTGLDPADYRQDGRFMEEFGLD